MNESKPYTGTYMNPQGCVDPTSKYYIDRMWEEYHKLKEELASTKCKLGQAEDYVNEVLKPELADAKIKLKMAQSAWDELDKSHAARAMLHDELVIAEGQRDQWKMKYEKAEVERRVDTGFDCAVCTTRIYGTMIGAGDGAGQKFAHPECYYRTCLNVAESERDALRTRAEVAEAELAALQSSVKAWARGSNPGLRVIQELRAERDEWKMKYEALQREVTTWSRRPSKSWEAFTAKYGTYSNSVFPKRGIDEQTEN